MKWACPSGLSPSRTSCPSPGPLFSTQTRSLLPSNHLWDHLVLWVGNKQLAGHSPHLLGLSDQVGKGGSSLGAWELEGCRGKEWTTPGLHGCRTLSCALKMGGEVGAQQMLHEQRNSWKEPEGRTVAECGWPTGPGRQHSGRSWPVCQSRKDIASRTQEGTRQGQLGIGQSTAPVACVCVHVRVHVCLCVCVCLHVSV